MTDYVIKNYNPIDYEKLIGYYGSYSALLTAVHSNTGSEYNIREDTLGGDDKAFRRIISYYLKHEKERPVRSFLSLPETRRQEMMVEIVTRVPGIKRKEAAKFLQLPYKRAP